MRAFGHMLILATYLTVSVPAFSPYPPSQPLVVFVVERQEFRKRRRNHYGRRLRALEVAL